MGTVIEIPLSPKPQTLFLDLGTGPLWGFRLRWLDIDAGMWVLDLLNSSGQELACGLPLVTGGDILHGLKYIGFPGVLYVVTEGDPTSPPSATNLGVTSHLMAEVA